MIGRIISQWACVWRLAMVCLPRLCLPALCLTTTSAMAQGRDKFADARNLMVDREIVGAGVKDARVVASMRATPRHEFVPTAQIRNAYFDMALEIGESQTISPPFVVAYMTESIDPQPTDKVLEIGTGSGYQAAVLSPLVAGVYTIEIVPSLGRQAARTLKRLRYDNVHAKVGDGYQGWPEHAPFDKIIVTCSPEKVPSALVAQLKEGGRMVVPVGERYQQTLYLMKKTDGKMVTEALQPTLFVPMTGRAEEGRQVQPDPAHPTLVGGGFEQTTPDPPAPAGWHYQRQLKLVTDVDAPEGKNYISFSNTEPGRGAQALQGFAVDGREVAALDVSLHVRGEGLRPGRNTGESPLLAVTFYDEKRAEVGRAILGPWRGTFPWRAETARIRVPVRAREAIICVGLLGGLGELSVDAVEIKAADL